MEVRKDTRLVRIGYSKFAAVYLCLGQNTKHGKTHVGSRSQLFRFIISYSSGEEVRVRARAHSQSKGQQGCYISLSVIAIRR